MTYEVYWADLGSKPNFEGLEQCPTPEMAVEWARIRLLFSSQDSFAFISTMEGTNRSLDSRTHRVHWEGMELVVYERDSADWNKLRVRPS
jgi:hypothetical protein